MNKNKEIIKQLNLVKQRVNQGSKAFRDQIDLNVLPLIKGYSEATEFVKQARYVWTFSDREAKRKINEAIAVFKSKPEPPKPDKAIKSFGVRNGRFIVDGKPTKLYGVSKREMIAVGSGNLPQSEVNYKYADIKRAILKSNINYIRVLAGKNIEFFRREVKNYLKHGIVVEVELFDAGNPNREYQAHWKNTLDAVEDLPVFFDAHNEFLEKDVVDHVRYIVNYVTNYSGIISAGAWSGKKGRRLVEKFKEGISFGHTYQIASHHREWTRKSLQSSMELGKPIVMSELHTRDHTPQQIKDLFRNFFKWGVNGCNIYPLQNYGMGQNSKFQKILDFVSDFREK